MAKKKFIWRVQLRLNLLTKDKANDYVAEVLTVGNTAKNEDIAQAIIEEGSEINYETTLSVLNRADGIKRTFLAGGRCVQDGVGHFKPKVPGTFDGATAKYDDSVNSITLEMTTAPEMYELLKEVGVEVIGVKDSGAYIGKVINAATGMSDEMIVPGDDIIIEGDKIKIAPEDEEGVGIFFTNTETGERAQVTKKLTKNDPKTIIARVPALSAGTYSLSIVTRYSKSNHLLQSPRTIVYDPVLSVE
jgi:hypothetical protein